MMFPIVKIKPATLADATGLSVCLPYEKHDQTFIISSADPMMAIFLDGGHAFHSFPAANTQNWKGALIDGVELLVDLASSYSPDRDGVILGSLIRNGDAVSIAAKVRDSHGFYDTVQIPLQCGLPEGGKQLRVGYAKWSIVRELSEGYITLHEAMVLPD